MKLTEDVFTKTPYGFTYLIERSRFSKTFDYMLVIVQRSSGDQAAHVTSTVTVDVKTFRDARDCLIAFSWDAEHVRNAITVLGGWPHREHREQALKAARQIGVEHDNAWILSQAGLLMAQDRAVTIASSEFH